MSEREDSDSDAPEEFTSEQGFELDEQIRNVQKENKARVVREGKERRRQWAQRKTPRQTRGTDGMLPENIVQLLAAREKKVSASDSEDEKDEAKPSAKRKKLNTAGMETVVLKNTESQKLAQSSLEFLKKKKMEVPRSSSILNHKNQARRLISTSDFLIKE